MERKTKNKEIEQLKTENARLKAALGEAEFQCQRLEILNANLESQLKESNRELEKNIEVLQEFKKNIDNIVSSLSGDKNE